MTPSRADGRYAQLLERLLAPLQPTTDAIAPGDTMFDGRLDHYLRVGQSAGQCIATALLAAGSPEPRTVLDMPCGHGRILRILQAMFPAARFTACDLDRAGVDHCATKLGAVPVYSDVDLAKVDFAEPFDLIWCGSLVTHLDVSGWLEAFRLFVRSLRVGGVAVVTFHGRWVAHALRHVYQYELDADQVATVLRGYEQSGFGYCDYRNSPGYGISLSSPAWVLRGIEPWTNLRVVQLGERQWDQHQDVLAVQRIQ